MTSQQREPLMKWKRQPNGQYVARHGFWVYTVWRAPIEMRGKQWALDAWPEANPDARQQRTGFTNSDLAKYAASNTRCFICAFSQPFGQLEGHHHDSRHKEKILTWRCRDRDGCSQRLAETLGEEKAEIQRQRSTDHAAIEIRDDEYGPQLVLTRSLGGGSSTSQVIDVTDNDLDTIQGLVAKRTQDRLWEAAEATAASKNTG